MIDVESSALIDLLKSERSANNPGLASHLAEVVEECEISGKSAMEVIDNFGLFTKQEMLNLIAENLGSYVWNPKLCDLTPDVIGMIELNTARANGVIPLKLEDGYLHLAMRRPLDYQTVESLRFILSVNILPVPCDPDLFESELDRYYPEKEDTVDDIVAELGDLAVEDEDDVPDEDKANEMPIVKFVDVIIHQAIKDKASDIHFEPFENEFKIRYRVDGALYELAPPPKNLAIPVISRVKIISGLNIAERRRPQDGRIQLKIAGKPIDLRVSTLPTQFGESVVLRVLDRSVVNLDLDVLGIADANLEKIRELIAMPNGIFVITGPTGSGKTTTLYSALKEINKVEIKVLTAEDPVEYDLEGIVQLPINDAVGMTFARALRAFLRQDPDVIMLGEIRDIESGEMAIQAALTGHLVFSTLHTNDAAGAITRFVDMGVEPFLIASAVIGVLGQRLIRRVCPKCKTAFDPDDRDLELLGLKREQIGNNKFYYGKGCPHCNNSGYKGRKALTELLLMSPQISELVLQNAPTVVIREKARELGMATMREDGIKAILNGETTMEEVLRYT